MLTSKTRASAIASGGGGGGGGGGSLVSIEDETISKFDAAYAYAAYEVNSSGLLYSIKNSARVSIGTWLLSGPSSDYEIRVTDNFGTLTSGSATSTWLALSSTRSWGLEVTSPDSITSDLTVEIRLAASPFTVLDTATVELNAIVF